MAALPSKDWENLTAQDPLEPSSETVKNYTYFQISRKPVCLEGSA